MAKVTVTIEGLQGSGKTRVEDIFRGALEQTPNVSRTTDGSFFLVTLFDLTEIEFVEKTTPEPNTATLGITVDASAAIANLDAVTDAAQRATDAVEKLRSVLR